MTDRIRCARLFAMGAHSRQKRKFTAEPYFHHCEEVANLVEEIGGTEHQIAAAWLHDVIEDCEVRLETICEEFGATVGDYVWSVTKPTNDLHLRSRLANAQPRAKTIKLADIISNLSTVEARDPAFAARYMVQKRRQLEWLAAGDAGLFARASEIVADYFTRHPEQLE